MRVQYFIQVAGRSLPEEEYRRNLFVDGIISLDLVSQRPRDRRHCDDFHGATVL
jgi:hypothetical protein